MIWNGGKVSSRTSFSLFCCYLFLLLLLLLLFFALCRVWQEQKGRREGVQYFPTVTVGSAHQVSSYYSRLSVVHCRHLFSLRQQQDRKAMQQRLQGEEKEKQQQLLLSHISMYSVIGLSLRRGKDKEEGRKKKAVEQKDFNSNSVTPCKMKNKKRKRLAKITELYCLSDCLKLFFYGFISFLLCFA